MWSRLMKEEAKHNLVMISGTFLHSTLFYFNRQSNRQNSIQLWAKHTKKAFFLIRYRWVKKKISLLHRWVKNSMPAYHPGKGTGVETLASKGKMFIRIQCGILMGNLCIIICSFQWHSLQKKIKGPWEPAHSCNGQFLLLLIWTKGERKEQFW